VTTVIAWERWDGTIECTFMAPVRRFTCLAGRSAFAVLAIASITQGLLLLCSSVYYQVTVLPGWLQPLAKVNPATHALDAISACWVGGAGLADVWPQVVSLLITGALLVPLGLWIFQMGERYARRTGKLTRNG
jgi:ABC-2 type transport system permease protein